MLVAAPILHLFLNQNFPIFSCMHLYFIFRSVAIISCMFYMLQCSIFSHLNDKCNHNFVEGK